MHRRRKRRFGGYGATISDLDVERGDLDGLARLLRYAADNREASARRALLDDYARHTSAIRHVYQVVLSE